jgi:hypothetical protein
MGVVIEIFVKYPGVPLELGGLMYYTRTHARTELLITQ